MCMNDKIYSWVKTHQQLTQYLKDKQNQQQELIELLKSIGISPFRDKSEEGDYDIELTEIDPFTFFCFFYKYGSKRRLKNIQKIAKKLNLHYPEGDSGIPSTQAQQVWMFSYKYKRTNNEINRLWDFFFKALEDKITDEDFADILTIRNVGKTKLTEALFNILPEKYFPINGPVKPYLENVLNIDAKFDTFSEYLEILKKVKEKNNKPFYQISHESWELGNRQANYWIFQCNPNHFDIENALKNEVIDSWTVTAHKEKIMAGDKAIIWVTGKKAGCYALADINSKPVLRTEERIDESHWKIDKRSEFRADISISHNLIDAPILKEEIEQIEALKNLKAGSQGTNFSATKEEYEAILEFINPSKFEVVKNKFKKEDFENYIAHLRKILKTINIEYKDQRVTFSLRSDRLSLTVGQRYCFSLFLNKNKGKFGVVSLEKLNESSETYKGNEKVFFTYFNNFEHITENLNEIIEAVKSELERTNKSGYRRHNNQDFENYVFERKTEMKPQTKPKTHHPLNTIFYGPPGTGKTYNTIKRAVEIIEGRKIDDYNEALKIYKEKLHNQIEFITFHQNYSYEDFIQGLRPDTENGNLAFEKRDGIFKKLVKKALENLKQSKESEEILNKEASFNYALEIFIEEVQTHETPFPLNETVDIIDVDEDAFRYSGQNWKHAETNGIRMKFSDLKEFYLNNISERKEIKLLENISSLSKVHATYYLLAYNNLKRHLPNKKVELKKEPLKNYVIIIDEINRANISRVFGELITLIEPDKRFGNTLGMEIILPSGDKFTIPNNLYIIGTMNTADKSIALLDIALRRRFNFEAMYPQYQIEEHTIYNKEVLQQLNEEIIKEKGHDFQIGHSYFMGEENKDLKNVMNNKVIPLLLEYFMNDTKTVIEILQKAGLEVDKNAYPLRINN